MNGNRLDPTKDIGNDGPNKVATDALAYSLGYYTGDYKPIGGSSSTAFSNQFQGSNNALTGQNLYNGNISSSTYAIAKINDGKTAGYSYGYDQLNRIKAMRQHDLGTTSGTITN